MNIDLDCLLRCDKCGVIFDYIKIGNKTGSRGYDDLVYKGTCPVCKEEWMVVE